MISWSILILGACCAGLTLADPIVDSVSSVTNPEDRAQPIDDHHIGYDLHNDYFYYQDQSVGNLFDRSKYSNTKITLAGQADDMTGQKVKDSVNPFAVAQKAVHVFGSVADRWDIKNTAKGYQFVGLYHGEKNSFVVNKLRAHLLRRLVNNVQDYLPALDLEVANSEENFSSTVKDEVKRLVEGTIRDLDTSIKEGMNDKDGASASASVVIVTKNYLVVANVGGGRVVAYEDEENYPDLTLKGAGGDQAKFGEFGNNKKNSVPCRPYVEIFPRNFETEDGDEAQYHFLVLETQSVGERIADEEVVRTVLGQIHQHKGKPGHEQEMYTGSVTRILQTVSDRLNLKTRLTAPDHSVILVGLNRDYSNIQ